LTLACSPRWARFPLRARCLAEFDAIGRHRSRRRGADVEFADYRDYQAGDDLPGRLAALCETDGFIFARLFPIRRSISCCCSDVSPSMAYIGPGTPRLSKLGLRRGLCSVLSRCWPAGNATPAGSGLLAENLLRWLPPGFSPARLEAVWSTLDAPATGPKTALATALGEVLDVPRALPFCLASDFLRGPRPSSRPSCNGSGPAARFDRAARARSVEISSLTHHGGFVDLETGQNIEGRRHSRPAKLSGGVRPHALN